ncbi:MAG: DUF3945 domain-containing protein [Prevotellaceae bacterium]|jgi:hypothetical protein|nr:DUF3945 domain-containing protein [Prevotellaceae bacterium]
MEFTDRKDELWAKYFGNTAEVGLKHPNFENFMSDLNRNELLRIATEPTTTANQLKYIVASYPTVFALANDDKYRSIAVAIMQHANTPKEIKETLQTIINPQKNIIMENKMENKKVENPVQQPAGDAELNHPAPDNAVSVSADSSPAQPEGLQDDPELTSPGKKIKGENGSIEIQKGSNLAEAFVGNTIRNAVKAANATPDHEGKPYEGIDPKVVNWDELSKWGVSRQDLEKSGALKDMLQGKKSGLVNMNFTSNKDGLSVHEQVLARLSFRKNNDNTWGFRYNLRKPKKSLNNLNGYYGYKFTEEDRSKLAITGNLGKIIMVNLPSLNPNEKTPVLLSLDRLTNELIVREASKVNVPQSILGVELTPEQQADLKNGRAVKVEGMLKKDGSAFDAELQYNTVNRRFDFVRNELANGIKKELTVDQQVDLLINRVAVEIKNGTDRSGQPYSAWIKYTPNRVDKKSISFYKDNPDEKKVVAPTIESSVQAQANNDGHKPEALKNVPDAVEQKQPATPTAKQTEKTNQRQQAKQGTSQKSAKKPGMKR